jgi:hypothetical protein
LRIYKYGRITRISVFPSETLKVLEKRKRDSNPFFLFRNDLKERAPKNIKMTELSKMASDSWKNLSEEDKAMWKRRYEINRDLPQTSTEVKDLVDEKTVDENDDNSIEVTTTDNVVIKVENI